MTDELNKNPFTALSEIAMTDEERGRVRANVHGFMALQPRTRWYGWFAQHVVVTLVLVLVLSSGGILWAADHAEPDSTLYGVRTSVNDQVRISLAGDDLDEVERELEILAEYIEQEEMLIARELAL